MDVFSSRGLRKKTVLCFIPVHGLNVNYRTILGLEYLGMRSVIKNMDSDILTLLEPLVRCRDCSAREEAKAPVYPAGPISQNGIMVIGRNPGRIEDLKGVPFCYRSGEFLDKYLAKCGLTREQVFVTNTVKCHTRGNREPDILEIITCSQRWLAIEINILKPRLIFVLGKDAFRGVFGYNISPWIINTGGVKNEVKTRGFKAVILPHPRAVIAGNCKLAEKYEQTIPEVRAIIQEMETSKKGG